MEKEIPFTGILSNKAEENPGFPSIELTIWSAQILLFFFFLVIGIAVLLMFLFLMFVDFFNWNRVKLRYCDGASFTGDSEDEVQFDILVFLN